MSLLKHSESQVPSHQPLACRLLETGRVHCMIMPNEVYSSASAAAGLELLSRNITYNRVFELMNNFFTNDKMASLMYLFTDIISNWPININAFKFGWWLEICIAL